MSYDVENRLVEMTPVSGPAVSFVYDGEGRRVQKVVGTTVITYVHDRQGNLMAEYGGAASTLCTTCYLTADHLGSTLMITDETGVVKQRRDYHPFGETILASASFANRQLVLGWGSVEV